MRVRALQRSPNQVPRRRSRLDLPLRTRPTWGGRRPRAGRRPTGDRPGMRHTSRASFRRLPSHVTLRVRPGLPSLRSVPIVAEIERSFRIARARVGPVVVDRYHSRALRTAHECRNALRYVLLNARRHAAKYHTAIESAVATLDPASSARWFDGSKARVPETERTRGTRPVASPVACARTWLLAVGWRRYGLIDPYDVPG